MSKKWSYFSRYQSAKCCQCLPPIQVREQTSLFHDEDALIHKIHQDVFLVCFGKDLKLQTWFHVISCFPFFPWILSGETPTVNSSKASEKYFVLPLPDSFYYEERGEVFGEETGRRPQATKVLAEIQTQLRDTCFSQEALRCSKKCLTKARPSWKTLPTSK